MLTLTPPSKRAAPFTKEQQAAIDEAVTARVAAQLTALPVSTPIPGERGEKGEKGDSIKGDAGQDGTSVTLADVEPLLNDKVAHINRGLTMKAREYADNAVAALPIPKDGARGPRGPKGDAGEDGANGKDADVSATFITLDDETETLPNSLQLVVDAPMRLDRTTRPGKVVLSGTTLWGGGGSSATPAVAGAAIKYVVQLDAEYNWSIDELSTGHTIVGVRTEGAIVRLPHNLPKEKLVYVKDETGGGLTIEAY